MYNILFGKSHVGKTKGFFLQAKEGRGCFGIQRGLLKQHQQWQSGIEP